MADLIIANPAQIVTPRSGPLKGPEACGLDIRKGDSILIRDGIIRAVAPLEQLEPADSGTAELDASGRAVIPGFTDSHTHLVFGGDRTDEFALRSAGASYQDIADAGGGIARTVAATRSASVRELKDKAAGYLDRALRQGTTTMEVKTGYGPDTDTELKMLRVIRELDREHPVDLIPTFLGAHAVPSGMDAEEYVEQVKAMIPEAARTAVFCDVFCERGYFTPAQSLDILETARDHGMQPRMHADQFNAIGCIEAAVELGAVSVDHLEAIEQDGIELLAETDTACTMLPGVSLFLDIPFAPGRKIIDTGCFPVLASDFNPGSNMSLSLQLVMTLACTRMGMSVDEALVCTTRNAARALLKNDRGRIEPGMQADLLVLDTPDYREMVYFYGENHVETVVKKGVVA